MGANDDDDDDDVDDDDDDDDADEDDDHNHRQPSEARRQYHSDQSTPKTIFRVKQYSRAHV